MRDKTRKFILSPHNPNHFRVLEILLYQFIIWRYTGENTLRGNLCR
jgi:hypothetical protein